MKKSIFWITILLVIVVGCADQNSAEPLINNKLNESWLNKIINKSDSSYSKPYFRSDFVTASYYINKKDSTLCQVMRDSAEHVRQVIITKNNIRTFYAQFYPNGQLIAFLPLNKEGQYHGSAVLYFPNGKIQSKGQYGNGLYNGTWEIFNEEGKLISTEEYNADGQLVKTTTY